MTSYPIFYYWLKNEITGEEKKLTTSDYLGDIDQKSADGWIILDWTMEEVYA